MPGLWGEYARIYALCIVAVTSVAFALPIFLVPLRWARWFQWRVPQDTDLAVYYGRCLGAFVLIMELFLLRAALTGEGLVFAFQFLLAAAAFMLVAHVWGWLAKIQPWTENAEIFMYGALLLATLLFYPGSAP